MAIRVALEHHTEYRFDRPVTLHPHVLRLRPAPHSRTPISAYSLRIEPSEHFINWQQDPFGNYLARLVFPKPARRLAITVEVIADLATINPFAFFVEEYAEKYPFSYAPALHTELLPYLLVTENGPLLTAWLASFDRSQRPINDFLVDLNRRLQRDIAYSVRMEPGVQTCEQTLERGIGSCRDTGWLLVQILRHLGLAARFVSGYLVQLTADIKSLDGPSGPEQDFTDLHAWTEVYVPGAGWLGLDPTSGLFAGEGHIPLACTAEPASAAPVTGATSTCEVEFYFRNTVTRIHEDPRVTKPYDDHQWACMVALGRQVDEDLIAGDVRLTQGGEPTFVSIDDMDGPEWTVAADGPHKRERARDLTQRLWQRFAPGGVLHFGQGKWYPGEALPRWALACYWRKDGVALWREPKLLADFDRDHGHDLAAAQRLAQALTGHLGVPARYLMAAFEDVFHYLWQEGQLPVDVDPLKVDLKSPAERRRLAELLGRGLGEPTGFVLPLHWDYRRNGWRSGPWPLRRQRLYLVPGDSPLGLRLPLDSLPWEAEREEPQSPQLFEPRPPLGDYYGEVARRYSQLQAAPPAPPEQAPADEHDEAAPAQIIHTALCIEARQGRLHIFLPPLTELEHYLELIAAIEASAAACDLPVVLEGYEPPRDGRLERLAVTPDPGVIEVNIHPQGSWDDLVETTSTLYELARQARLGTEKFMLDGRHTGTGGGNHITLGGPTPSDSPLLRRPDLLRSLITYWQHHPGLSFLFSGLFIGPTSQAPRVDEARHESLYELDIAFQQMPDGEASTPWLVDRLLRNLLVDLTGNTHRAEFCIDKLYAPGSATGRLGLLELRAFEMPPHAQMSLFQALLLRALVARFWAAPYCQPPVRWGSGLHDRFMLPHYVAADMRAVLAELRQAGYPFQDDWLDPFVEFRFPRYGTVQVGDLTLELRAALEPWHVMGEEATAGGTARYVDSSVERLQVRLTGASDGRYLVACNGRRVPLQATGTHGEQVAGVRYRAWSPPSALHPTIGPHAPLVFDIIDTWNGRSIGGCTYHVAHPGGRNYETFPVNAYEAEGRRIMRFWNYGHTAGAITPPPPVSALGRFLPHGSLPPPLTPPPEAVNADYPHTLDLRWRPV